MCIIETTFWKLMLKCTIQGQGTSSINSCWQNCRQLGCIQLTVAGNELPESCLHDVRMVAVAYSL